jgi:hypothetical protein
MVQALELDPNNRRAQFGLVSVCNAYLEVQSKNKNADEHEIEVAKELIKFGSEQCLLSYEGTPMFGSIKALMNEYTEGI